MKQLSIILLAFAAFWLAGCTVEEINNDSSHPLPEGVTRLSAAIASGAKTRAVGDPLTDATSNEKRIDRIAFFVHTEAEGMQVYPPLGTGETAADFPNKVALKDNGDGSYSATVDLVAGAGYDADIVAIANLPADYDYGQIVTWKGLLDSVTYAVNPPEMPTVTDVAGGKAFIMQGNTTVALHKEKEEKFSLTMERLVARIDITNMAYSGDPKSGFNLSGARILQAMPGSYLYPHDLYASPDMQTVTSPSWSFDDTAVKYYMGEVEDANDKTADVGANPNAADRQAVWHNLYTYENSDTQHAPTAVEISGTFRGSPITRRIPFEAIQPDGITKKPVPIVRNHRYLLLIKPAPGLTDLTYSITVADWNAVDTINVQPNQDQVPVVTGVTQGSATKIYANVTSKLDTIVVPAAGGMFKFTAACPFDTKVSFGYADPAGGDEQDWLSATSTEATLVQATKASTTQAYQREYTVTVKASSTLNDTYVNRGYLYLTNGANGSIVDTITVYQGKQIAYGETRLAAVMYHDTLWAPVNCGAKVVLKSTDKITAGSYSPDTLGYLYQWGRNVPFTYGGEDATPNDTILTTIGLKYADACENEGMYANRFFYVWPGGDGANGTLNGYSWFNPNNTYPTTWPREHQPCPKGWRVPTYEELSGILSDNPTVGTDGTWSSGDFILPAAGYRSSHDGVSQAMGTTATFWSSSVNATGTEPDQANRLNFFKQDGGTNSVSESGMAGGLSVRCVQE